MNDEEFRQKLSEVAEWEIPKLSSNEIKLSQQRKRGRKSNEEQYQDAHEEIFLDIHNGINPSVPPELLKVKHKHTTCGDCGRTCENGCHKEKKLYETGQAKKRNWRERCVTCGLHKNPFTGKFDMTPSESPHVWTSFLRDSKGIYKTQGNAAREDTVIITINPEKPHKI